MVIKLSLNNWMTTIGGILAGIPPIVLTSFTSAGVPLSQKWTAILSIVSGVGALVIGLAAKDFNTHSSATQVAESTAKTAAGELPKV